MTEVKPPIRLYLLDDHALFREGLLRLLDADPRFTVSGHAGDSATALRALRQSSIDTLILDYDLGADNALDFMRQLRQQGHTGAVLVVTAGLPERDAFELIRLGISGICRKQDSPDELTRAIEAVAQGRMLIDQRYLQSIVASGTDPDRISFTERERAVLRSLLQGSSNKQIARQLSASESAIKATFQQLFNKLEVRSRSQLVRIVLQEYRELI